MKTNLFILLLSLLAIHASCQDNKYNARNSKLETGSSKPTSSFRIAFYNVENLFDTIDDPKINDADFLPDARIPWTSERYERKLSRIAEVVKALSDPKPFAILGLCEVENQAVLQDLLDSPMLVTYPYRYIHHDSPDERGIDNVMIYDPGQFVPVSILPIGVHLSDDPNDKTRDILYVKGYSPEASHDTLHVFVNHWPSRYGGQEVSEPKRMEAARTLKAVTDSLFAANPDALIVIIGDLNEEPADKSLTEGLNALQVEEAVSKHSLYNLMYLPYLSGSGTIYYKDWDVFDQVILSGNFWNKPKGLTFDGEEAVIYNADWLMFINNEGIARPNRTAAREYYGGYSDHLPVFVDLYIYR